MQLRGVWWAGSAQCAFAPPFFCLRKSLILRHFQTKRKKIEKVRDVQFNLPHIVHMQNKNTSATKGHPLDRPKTAAARKQLNRVIAQAEKEKAFLLLPMWQVTIGDANYTVHGTDYRAAVTLALETHIGDSLPCTAKHNVRGEVTVLRVEKTSDHYFCGRPSIKIRLADGRCLFSCIDNITHITAK